MYEVVIITLCLMIVCIDDGNCNECDRCGSY